MSKGTIIYVGGFELPDKNAAAHRVLSNAKAFRKLGYNVVFVGVDKSLGYDAEISGAKKLMQDFECWSVPYPNTIKQRLDYFTSINRTKYVIEKYSDVKAVICYNYQAVAFNKLRSFCGKKNIKIMADCTEWYSCRGNGLIYGIRKGLDSFIRMRVIHRKLDGLIVISRYLERYYHKCNNVVCIPPLVDMEEEKWKRQGKDEKNDLLTIVYAGSPGKNKDRLDVVVESISDIKSPRILLNIIGITKEQFLSIYPKGRSTLENALCEINFLGRLEHTSALNYIKSADFTVFFRDDNRVSNAGFPTKLVESISCGVPVITNRTSNVDEYIIDGYNGFILKKEFTREMTKLMDISLMELRQLKKNMVMNKFDYNSYVDKFHNLIK